MHLFISVCNHLHEPPKQLLHSRCIRLRSRARLVFTVACTFGILGSLYGYLAVVCSRPKEGTYLKSHGASLWPILNHQHQHLISRALLGLLLSISKGLAALPQLHPSCVRIFLCP